MRMDPNFRKYIRDSRGNPIFFQNNTNTHAYTHKYTNANTHKHTHTHTHTNTLTHPLTHSLTHIDLHVLHLICRTQGRPTVDAEEIVAYSNHVSFSTNAGKSMCVRVCVCVSV